MQSEIAIRYITNQMNLRIPQAVSLTLFADYLESEAGQLLLERLKNKTRQPINDLLTKTQSYLSNIKEAKGFTSFERAFPTYTFAVATGVGKTRLMGAFVTYLYLVHDIHHFLLVAPSLTIFRKLLDDFSKSNNPKYVFRGITEINTTNTKIITSANFKDQHGTDLYGNKLEINIFNIQQFAQKEMNGERGITKSWESAGRSHFEYLKSQTDLVVMLDEAHHYHADAALKSLDLMDPMLGLEFTATPYQDKGALMKNVLYTYNLGDAIRGKLVKDPWVGTEADVDFRQFDSDDIETDLRKIHLACYFHERAKVALTEYATSNNLTKVKPVLLIVTKDTDHAKAISEKINSNDFRDGQYLGKVLEIHTKIKGDETEETIQKLISLEDPRNPVEIVIHVNMLKEGWDVNNVYTILPLRQSAAQILTEQTIGRGLRLPYGKRTGVPLVDRLVLVAHENFARIVQLAKDSELIQGTEEIRTDEIDEIANVISVQPKTVEEVKKILDLTPSFTTQITAEATKELKLILLTQNYSAPVAAKMLAVKIIEKKTIIARQIVEEDGWPADSPFAHLDPDMAQKVKKITQNNHINIPKLILTPIQGEAVISDFDLDSSLLSYHTNEHSILEEQLQHQLDQNLLNETVVGKRDSQTTKIHSIEMGSRAHQPSYYLILELQEYDFINYNSSQKSILLKLADQAINHYKKKAIDTDNLLSIIKTNARQIAKEIYDQVIKHTTFENQGFEVTELRDGDKTLLTYNYSTFNGIFPVSLNSQVDSFSSKYIYTKFTKACHEEYRFDSSDEVRFAYLLERDDSVFTWLHPAPKQFEYLKYRDELGYERSYEPDFVVELNNEIVLAEVKMDKELNNTIVLSKKKTGIEYCKVVSLNIGKYGITKPWRYVLIPASKITLQSTITALFAK